MPKVRDKTAKDDDESHKIEPIGAVVLQYRTDQYAGL